MKNYGTPEMLELLREAVNIGANGEVWHHAHMLWAQSMGLQGYKRLNRYESCKDRAHYIKLQNYALDMFGEILQPSWDYVVTAPEDIKGYLEGYIVWENSVYTRLADISSRLIVMGFPSEAKLVREGLPRKELEKVRRMLTEYGLSGWDMTYILPRTKSYMTKSRKRRRREPPPFVCKPVCIFLL